MPDRRTNSLPFRLFGLICAVLLPSLAFAAAEKGAGKAAARPMPPPIRAALEDRDLRSQDNPGEAMKFDLKKRLPKGETSLPVERYVTAKVQMERMARFDLATAKPLSSVEPEADRSLASWAPLGPGNIGGRTRALVIDPRTPRTFYAGGVDGGVWKSTNAGTSWAPIGDLLSNLAVTTLVIDPTSSATLYAGTGEGVFNGDASQ